MISEGPAVETSAHFPRRIFNLERSASLSSILPFLIKFWKNTQRATLLTLPEHEQTRDDPDGRGLCERRHHLEGPLNEIKS